MRIAYTRILFIHDSRENSLYALSHMKVVRIAPAFVIMWCICIFEDSGDLCMDVSGVNSAVKMQILRSKSFSCRRI